jgi:hypothetical protein
VTITIGKIQEIMQVKEKDSNTNIWALTDLSNIIRHCTQLEVLSLPRAFHFKELFQDNNHSFTIRDVSEDRLDRNTMPSLHDLLKDIFNYRLVNKGPMGNGEKGPDYQEGVKFAKQLLGLDT